MFEGLLEPAHLLLILFVALLIFGPQKIPELGKALGESIRAFKKAISTTDSDNLPSDSTRPALTDERDGSRANEKHDN